VNCAIPLAAMKEKLGHKAVPPLPEVTMTRKDDDTFTRTCVLLVVGAGGRGGGGGKEAS
jgi:hypothetical protein